MDTITYNLDSKKAKIKGVATQQGDGWLVGGSVKKMPDNTINIEHGKYTTCDHTDHPHFYLAMTKAKVIPGKKVITGPAYLVMEDVPIYFLGIPEGFFPINMGPKSGLLMPTYGEEYSKGFFLRDLGYYFTLGEYADLAAVSYTHLAGGGRFSAPACRPSRGSAARTRSPRPSGPWRAACRSRPGSRPNRRSAPRRDGSLR